MVRKLRVGAMPPRGVAPARPRRRPTRLIAWLEGELDRAGTNNPGPAHAAPTESRRVRQRDSRSPRARRRRHVAAAAGRRRVRFRQRRGRAGQLAGAAAGLSRRGAEDQRGRRRRLRASAWEATRTRRGRISRRTCTSTDCRSARSAGFEPTHTFPLDGEYEFQVRLYRTNLSAMRGLEDPQEVELTARRRTHPPGVDRRRGGSDRAPDEPDRHLGHHRGHAAASPPRSSRRASATSRPRSSRRRPPTFETHRLQRFIRDFANPFDAEGAPHVLSITIQGPFNATAARPPPSPRVFVVHSPPVHAEEAGCATRILSTLARARLPPPGRRATEIADLMSSYEQGRSNGSFEDRRPVRTAAHPGQPVVRLPSGSRAGGRRRGHAIPHHRHRAGLASLVLPLEQHPRRRTAARWRGEGASASRHVLAAQMRRMLADPRSSAFVTQLRRAVAPPAQPARHHPELGSLSRLRRQPASGVSARGRALLREHAARRSQRARSDDRRLHVRQRTPGATLRHPERLRQRVPPRAG